MNTFWNSNCCAPWDCWSLGGFECMLMNVSNNVQESWHSLLQKKYVGGAMKGSTESVLQVVLPKIIRLDGLFKADELTFEVPAIPKAMMEKALWYIEHQSTHILADRDQDQAVMFFFLSKTNTMGAKKLLMKHLEAYNAAWSGIMDRRAAGICDVSNVYC